MIFLYNIAWILALPLVLGIMIFRIVTGKEDIMRITERLGIPSVIKSSKNIIWIHAASVGESKIALTLTANLQKKYKKHKILITTSTVASAALIRKNLNGAMIHQYIPLDNYLSIKCFFYYWEPQIGILVECELWPNLTYIGSKSCPLILANARMSDRSFRKWQKYSFAFASISKRFKTILCQSVLDHNKYVKLGASNAIKAGNLKYSASKLQVAPHKLRVLKNQIKDRIIFLAASTHPKDEKVITDVHLSLKKKYDNLLTIIAPRHVNRMEEILDLTKKKGLKTSVRSSIGKISPETDIYIADTMGELGLFFNVSKATFVGGSFSNGGHNLIEPAYFNNVIIFGPDMSNCREVAEEFLEKKAAYQIQNTEELFEILDKVYSGQIVNDKEKANLIIQSHINIINNYLSYIDQYLKK